MSNNPDNEKITTNKSYPIDLAQKITIIKGTSSSDQKVPHLVTSAKLSGVPGQIIPHTLPLSLMRPSTQIIPQGISSQAQLVSGGHTLTGTVVGTAGVANPLLHGAQIVSQGVQSGATVGGISGQGTVRSLQASVRVIAPLNLPTVPLTLPLPLNLPLQQQGHLATPVNAPSARSISTIATPVTTVKQITTSYHVPRGPAAVASLAVPRGSAAPRVSTPTPAWSTGVAQIRTGALVYAPRPPRPHTLQIATTRPTLRQVTHVSTTVVARAIRPANSPSPQRTPPPQSIQTLPPVRSIIPKVLPLVQRNYQPGKVVCVATLGLRPTIPPRPVGGTFYYEVSSGTAGPTGQTLLSSVQTPTVAAIPTLSIPTSVVTPTVPTMSTMSSISSLSSMPTAHSAAQILTHVPLLAPVNSFSGTITNSNDMSRAPNSPGGPQRPSILRKRDNEGSPMKSQNIPVVSPPPSPGGSTTVSATSTPEPEDDDHSTSTPPPPNIINNSMNIKTTSSMPINSNSMSLMSSMTLQSIPSQQMNNEQSPYNNCSPRKKPRKQLLSSEAHCGSRVGDFEFPSEGAPSNSAPSPPTMEPHINTATNATTNAPATVLQTDATATQPEKPPKLQLGAGWRCGWRATALHFTRPSDVRIREEKRPSVVELASQRHVLQKANGWKLHHLTAQMDDLRELELGVLEQAAAALQVLESKPSPDLHRLCELLKGNIQRSKIVGEGVAEARANVLRIFQHKGYVSDILARQADKRCFKKHRNQC